MSSIHEEIYALAVEMMDTVLSEKRDDMQTIREQVGPLKQAAAKARIESDFVAKKRRLGKASQREFEDAQQKYEQAVDTILERESELEKAVSDLQDFGQFSNEFREGAVQVVLGTRS